MLPRQSPYTERINDAVSPLAPELLAALRAFADHPRVLVALDFDGTLSPLVDRPQDARPLPESAAYVARLGALDQVYTAVVSGRNLDSLGLVYPPPVPEIRIGSHGAERHLPGELAGAWHDEPLSPEQTTLLATVTSRLADVAARFENVSLEYKPSATVLHVRQASAEVGEAAIAEAKQSLGSLEQLRLLEGKAVLEASVHQGDKGQALSWLRDILRVDAVLFVGDDVTDENGFSVLNSHDVGIKVGDGKTLATHRIGSPHDIPALLKYLISMRD